MAPSCLRMLEDLQSLSRATDVTQWRAAWDASSHGFLKLDKLPAAAQQLLLEQHEITTALTSAIAAGLRVLMPLLPSISSGNKNATGCTADVVTHFEATSAWCHTFLGPVPTLRKAVDSLAAQHACKLLQQGMSAAFTTVAPKACQAVAQLLPELTLQEVQQQQRYRQQAGRAARRHSRNNPDEGRPSTSFWRMVQISWHLLALWGDLSIDCPLHGQHSAHLLGSQGDSSPCSSDCSKHAGAAANAAAAAITDSVTGTRTVIFPDFLVHATPLAAAMLRCWQLLQLSAAGSEVDITHMSDLIQITMQASVKTALSVCEEIRQAAMLQDPGFRTQNPGQGQRLQGLLYLPGS